MQHVRNARRSVLLALTLLSACAASNPSSDTITGSSPVSDAVPDGALGNYLAGRFALSQADYQTAATDLLKAAVQSPDDPDVTLQAFIATLDAGRPEAVKLARQLPDSQVAQLVLADVDVKAGRWQAAEQRFHGLPRQGLTQLLQPLLVAWAQQGEGRTDAALSTLQPYIDNPRFRNIFTLHGAMIADLGGRQQDAARLYRATETGLSEPNLRMAQILASWEARSRQPAEAQRILASLPTVAPNLSIVLPGLMADLAQRPVPNPTDGIAEAYFTFAALLQAQDANDFSLIMLRLALDLRPDFAAARLLVSEILQSENHPRMALRSLIEVPASDPLIAIVQLRRAALTYRLGRPDDAMGELERLAKAYPDSPLPDEQRGDILRAKQKFADATQAYDQAIARIPQPSASDWIVFYDRGIAEERTHQWPKAEADFNRALELSPNQPYVLNYLGYSLADMGHQLGKARQMIQHASEQLPNDSAITDSLGWVMYRQGDTKDAVKTLEHAVELQPEDATINGHLGDAYWAAGRKIEAQYQWRRALTLDPTADDAAKLEAKLKTDRPGDVISGQ